MKKNEGVIDRVIRIILGIILIGLGVFFLNSWGWVATVILVILGLIALVTGVIGYCHLYTLLKFTTLKKS